MGLEKQEDDMIMHKEPHYDEEQPGDVQRLAMNFMSPCQG